MVYATPMMILEMEMASADAITPFLEPGWVTVGTEVDIRHLAATPVGSFRVQREVDADVKAPLGTLHRPLYFYQGWAVHGAASVPAYPASHGCVRVSDADADWLFPLVPIGTAVVIYDTTGRSPAPGQVPGPARRDPEPTERDRALEARARAARSARYLVNAVVEGSPAVVTLLAILSALVLGALLVAFSDTQVLHAWSQFFSSPGNAISQAWDAIAAAMAGCRLGRAGAKRSPGLVQNWPTPRVNEPM